MIKNIEKDKIIDTMKELMKFIFDISTSDEKYLFRGQGSKEWKIESSYMRKNTGTIKSMAPYIFQDRINYIKEHGIEKNNLSILAEMQHHGLETLLIDFTSNILHALWFAFSESLQEKDETEYRTLYLLKNNKKNKFVIGQLNEEKKEEIYECPMDISRGLSQKSYFILDNIDWNINENLLKIQIANKLQDKILAHLNNKFITASKIYPDLKGLGMEFDTNSSMILFNKGNALYELKKYPKAIECYKRAIKLEPENFVIYHNKGNALYELKEYPKAIKCYKKVTELIPSNSYAWFSMGKVYRKLNEDKVKEGSTKEADEYLKKAEECLRKYYELENKFTGDVVKTV